MNTYFAIMITILAAAQIIGILQNAMYHHKRKKKPYKGDGKNRRSGYHGKVDGSYRKDRYDKGDGK